MPRISCPSQHWKESESTRSAKRRLDGSNPLLLWSAWGGLLPLLMFTAGAVGADLDSLPAVRDLTSHRESSYDRTGGNIDNIESFPPGETRTLLDVDGPGRITHIWMTISVFPYHYTYLRDLVLRMYWENHPVPAVEVPLGDFFVQGHSQRAVFESAPIAVGGNNKALNCYWPMPFYQHARIELYNNGRRSLRRIYFHVDYEKGPLPPEQGLFHAVFSREKELRTQKHGGNLSGEDNYVILETTGKGQYVGCALFIDAQPGGWWGEGDDMIFIDGSENPVIIGTGSEDYFNNAWGFEEPFSYPYYGCPLLEKRPDGGTFTSVYRWHIPDPIRFSKSIKVTMEHIYSDKVTNDYSSVAYWYQLQPIDKRAPLPRMEENHPRQYVTSTQPAPTRFELDGTELEADLNQRGAAARSITTSLHAGFKNGGYLRIDKLVGPLEINIPVPEAGTYAVHVRPVGPLIEESINLSIKGGEAHIMERPGDQQHKVPYVDLGRATSADKTITIVVSGQATIGLDHLRIEKVP